MMRATSVQSAPFPAGVTPMDAVALDAAGRSRRRGTVKTIGGDDLLIDLEKSGAMQPGCGLMLEGGGMILVRAAPEQLLQIHAHDIIGLARICWHLGNRHTPIEIAPDALYILPDHVLAEMIEGLGGHIHVVERPFEPEGGAYGNAGSSGHAHTHSHDHDHG